MDNTNIRNPKHYFKAMNQNERNKMAQALEWVNNNFNANNSKVTEPIVERVQYFYLCFLYKKILEFDSTSFAHWPLADYPDPIANLAPDVDTDVDAALVLKYLEHLYSYVSHANVSKSSKGLYQLKSALLPPNKDLNEEIKYVQSI